MRVEFLFKNFQPDVWFQFWIFEGDWGSWVNLSSLLFLLLRSCAIVVVFFRSFGGVEQMKAGLSLCRGYMSKILNL